MLHHVTALCAKFVIFDKLVYQFLTIFEGIVCFQQIKLPNPVSVPELVFIKIFDID